MQPIEEITLKTERTARIALLGQPGPEVRHLWLVLHGYRQLAPYFLRKFSSLARPDTLIAAPEGLSRFYLDGYYGKVGASWMTREARLDEIADQISYLDRVLVHLRSLLPAEALRVHLLGFSQGLATAWRWLMHGQVDIDSFVLWTGRPPAEENPALLQRLPRRRMVFVYATEDQFLAVEKARVEARQLQARFPQLQLLEQAGGHDILPETLEEVAKIILK